MRYLIDTDISSYYLRGKFNLSDVFEGKGFQNIRLSIVTVAELEVLAHRNPESKINLSSIHFFSEKIGVLDVDRETWRVFSLMKAESMKRGLVKGDFDILIASVCKRYGMIIVTNNTAHYEGLVDVENWTR